MSDPARRLAAVLEHGRGRVDPEQLLATSALRAQVTARLAHGDGVTVAALVGGTGVGTSALVNRLVGQPVVTEGVRRPTTDRPVAVVDRLDLPRRQLLDWLEIDQVRVVGGTQLPELVLLDLPDHDSVVHDHRRTAAQLARRVDALVVVVDPLKYARADLHRGPLAALRHHAEVVVVALNRADELTEADQHRCHADLTARLAASGLEGIEVVTTSARTGQGVGELRDRLTALASTRTAALRRLEADTTQLLAGIAAQLPPDAPPPVDTDGLMTAVLAATGADTRLEQAEHLARRRGRRMLRSPLHRAGTALVGGLGRAARTATGRLAATPTTTEVPLEPAASAVERALGRAVGLDQVTGRDHTRLTRVVAGAATDAAPWLLRAVRRHDPEPDPPWWWTAVSWLHGGLELSVVTGLLWLTAATLTERLRLPELPVPELAPGWSLPGVLVLGGIILRLLTGLAARGAVRVGARRHRRRLARALSADVGAEVRARLLAPIEVDRQRGQALREALAAPGARIRSAPPPPRPERT